MKKIALMVLFLVLALGLIECRHHHHSFDYNDHYGYFISPGEGEKYEDTNCG